MSPRCPLRYTMPGGYFVTTVIIFLPSTDSPTVSVTKISILSLADKTARVTVAGSDVMRALCAEDETVEGCVSVGCLFWNLMLTLNAKHFIFATFHEFFSLIRFNQDIYFHNILNKDKTYKIIDNTYFIRRLRKSYSKDFVFLRKYCYPLTFFDSLHVAGRKYR